MFLDSYVVCEFCGKHYQVLSSRHLATHGTTREEYMTEFGLGPDSFMSHQRRREIATRRDYRPLTQKAVHKKIRAIYGRHGDVSSGFVKRFWPQYYMQAIQMHGCFNKALKELGLETWLTKRARDWTPERVIEEIKQLHEKSGTLSVGRELVKENKLLLWYAARFFGNWRNAIQAAGFSLQEVSVSEAWSREKVIARIRQVRKRKNLTEMEFLVLHRASHRYLGGMDRALKQAGFSWEGFYGKTKWSEELILSELRKYKKLYGKTGSRKIAEACPDLRSNAIRYFGGWNAALERVGIKTARVHHWTKETLAAELKRLLRGKKSTTPKYVREKLGERFYAAALNHFGSWEAAMAAAGLNFEKSKEEWDRGKIIQRIQALHRSGELGKGVSRKHPHLYAASAVYFDSWSNAVAAAGCHFPKRIKWNEDMIFSGIRDFLQSGHPNVQKANPKLYKAAVARFGSWGTTLTRASEYNGTGLRA